MPKTILLRSPYRLSLPSPLGDYHSDRHSSPYTPSPPSRVHPKSMIEAPFKGRKASRDAAFERLNVDHPKRGAPEKIAKPASQAENDVQHSSIERAPSTVIENSSLDSTSPPRGSRTPSADLKAKVVTTQRRLRRAHREIEELKERVKLLAQSEKRLKTQVSKQKELVKDVKVQAEESLTELVRAEERLGDMKAYTTALRRDFNQYRGWWLTENLSLKIAMREIPKRKWDAGFESMAASSHSRYMSYCGSGSN